MLQKSCSRRSRQRQDPTTQRPPPRGSALKSSSAGAARFSPAPALQPGLPTTANAFENAPAELAEAERSGMTKPELAALQSAARQHLHLSLPLSRAAGAAGRAGHGCPGNAAPQRGSGSEIAFTVGRAHSHASRGSSGAPREAESV